MPIRVLYIEDNFDNRLLVQRVLMAEGFDVRGVETAREGIQLAIADPPDIILMDINMPGISGLDATRQLRETPECENTPIVALTANITQTMLDEAMEAGCDGYITKPVDIDKLPVQIMSYVQS